MDDLIDRHISDEDNQAVYNKSHLLSYNSEEKVRKKDTIIRKLPKHAIRQESFDFLPLKLESVQRRVLENELITSARVRQAQRKA